MGAELKIIHDLEMHADAKLRQVLSDHLKLVQTVVDNGRHGAASCASILMMLLAEMLAFTTHMPAEEAGQELAKLITRFRDKRAREGGQGRSISLPS